MENLKRKDAYFQDRNARRSMEKLNIPPLTIVEANGLKTMYSKIVATAKWNTNHMQSKIKALFQRLDMNNLFLITGYFSYQI